MKPAAATQTCKLKKNYDYTGKGQLQKKNTVYLMNLV